MSDGIEGRCYFHAGQLTARDSRIFVWENQKSYATWVRNMGKHVKLSVKILFSIRSVIITSETKISRIVICYADYQFFLCSSEMFRRRDVVPINASVAWPISFIAAPYPDRLSNPKLVYGRDKLCCCGCHLVKSSLTAVDLVQTHPHIPHNTSTSTFASPPSSSPLQWICCDCALHIYSGTL